MGGKGGRVFRDMYKGLMDKAEEGVVALRVGGWGG